MCLIADEGILFESPDPNRIYCYTSGLVHAHHGRILASFDLDGSGTDKLSGLHSDFGDYPTSNQFRFIISEDHGFTWHPSASPPMPHAMLFNAHGTLWYIGHSGRLLISSSEDNGENWSKPSVLDDAHDWHQSACHVAIHNNKVFLAYEQRIPGRLRHDVAPVLLCTGLDKELHKRENWTFSEPFDAKELFQKDSLYGIVQFSGEEPGKLETYAVRITDPHSYFFDPNDCTVFLFMRVKGVPYNKGTVLKEVEKLNGGDMLILSHSGDNRAKSPHDGNLILFHHIHDFRFRAWHDNSDCHLDELSGRRKKRVHDAKFSEKPIPETGKHYRNARETFF